MGTVSVRNPHFESDKLNIIANSIRGCTLLGVAVALGACAQIQSPLAERLGDQGPAGVSLAANERSVEAINNFFDRRRGRTITVSQFDDLSGARTENGTSTVVAASGRILTEYLLLRANTADNYAVLDRAGLNNLINERRLADQVNAINEAKTIAAAPAALREALIGRVPPAIDLPPLLVTDYMIYGAVVGYDKALNDNGGGIGVAGVRVRNRASRDQVSVIMQLVDVRTGEIFATGFSSRFIDSTSLGSDVFALLRVDRLLEFEQMNVVNDPATRALFFAIDSALMEMFNDA